MTASLTPGEPPTGEARYREILTLIIKRFVLLVGAPIALHIARKIPGLSVDNEGTVLAYNQEDPFATISSLISQYNLIFGDMAIGVVQRATQPVIADLPPMILKETGLAEPGALAPVRILLVDDHALFREGLIRLLGTQSDMKVIGQAENMQQAIQLARELKPDLVLMDINMPGGTGVEATQTILAELPQIKVMFVTVYDDDERVFAALRAGAVGYSSKNVRATELLSSLRAVAKGETVITPPLARRLLNEFSRLSPHSSETPPAQELTKRELEIVSELAQGASNRDIAQKLAISEYTVKSHVRNILAKLHLGGRREVVAYVRERNLTQRKKGD